MSESRCSFCTRAMDSYKKIQQLHASSNSDCDVCSLLDYLKEFDKRASYTNAINIYPFHKSNRKNISSKSKRTDRSISVYRYFVNALAMSSINGVSNWAKSKTGIWKFLWLLVIICCAAGYGFQTFTFYSRYRSNPTLVQLQVENDGQVEFPAVSICNANR